LGLSVERAGRAGAMGRDVIGMWNHVSPMPKYKYAPSEHAWAQMEPRVHDRMMHHSTMKVWGSQLRGPIAAAPKGLQHTEWKSVGPTIFPRVHMSVRERLRKKELMLGASAAMKIMAESGTAVAQLGLDKKGRYAPWRLFVRRACATVQHSAAHVLPACLAERGRLSPDVLFPPTFAESWRCGYEQTGSPLYRRCVRNGAAYGNGAPAPYHTFARFAQYKALIGVRARAQIGCL
jgi:hypothetical protein